MSAISLQGLGLEERRRDSIDRSQIFEVGHRLESR